MKINWRYEILPITLIAAAFIMGFIALPNAPEQVPIHWGFSGQPDNYANKFVGLFSAPLIMTGIYAMMIFMPRIDPKRYNYAKFPGAYTAIRSIIIFSLAGIQLFTVLWTMDIKVNLNIAIFVITGLLLALLGNFFGKLRPTWFVGIRLPWTLSSEKSWDKTHRLGGRMFVLTGLAMVIAAPFQNQWAFITLGIIFGLTLIFLAVYSYLIWKKDPDARKLGDYQTDR